MGYDRCKTCDKWHWDNVPCDPIYSVSDEEYMGDEKKNFYAGNFEDAALQYASWYNMRCDYILMKEEREVIVERDGKQKKFIISAEPSVHYNAVAV